MSSQNTQAEPKAERFGRTCRRSPPPNLIPIPHPAPRSNNLAPNMKTAAEIMDTDVSTVQPDDDARKAIDLLAKTDHGAIAVVDEANVVTGIVSESDLILSDEESDLHLPHYLEIMGGIVFIGSMKGFDKRLEKAF